MSTVFTQIMARQLPSQMVWADDLCVAFASIEPARPGHMLVVPRQEVDSFVDVDPDLGAHLFEVARIIGSAQVRALGVKRAGIVVAGFDVPHLHIHVIPADSIADMNMMGNVLVNPAELAGPAEALRRQLAVDGFGERVPA